MPFFKEKSTATTAPKDKSRILSLLGPIFGIAITACTPKLRTDTIPPTSATQPEGFGECMGEHRDQVQELIKADPESNTPQVLYCPIPIPQERYGPYLEGNLKPETVEMIEQFLVDLILKEYNEGDFQTPEQASPCENSHMTDLTSGLKLKSKNEIKDKRKFIENFFKIADWQSIEALIKKIEIPITIPPEMHEVDVNLFTIKEYLMSHGFMAESQGWNFVVFKADSIGEIQLEKGNRIPIFYLNHADKEFDTYNHATGHFNGSGLRKNYITFHSPSPLSFWFERDEWDKIADMSHIFNVNVIIHEAAHGLHRQKYGDGYAESYAYEDYLDINCDYPDVDLNLISFPIEVNGMSIEREDLESGYNVWTSLSELYAFSLQVVNLKAEENSNLAEQFHYSAGSVELDYRNYKLAHLVFMQALEANEISYRPGHSYYDFNQLSEAEIHNVGKWMVKVSDTLSSIAKSAPKSTECKSQN